MALGFSPLDVLVFVGLGAAGFLVVALVCAGILALLQLILPSVDSGAAALDAAAAQADALAHTPAAATDDGQAAQAVDGEADA